MFQALADYLKSYPSIQTISALVKGILGFAAHYAEFGIQM
jgi:hypothetical protein